MTLAASISPELTGRVRLGFVAIDGVDVRAHSPSVAGEIASETAAIRQRFAGEKSGDVPGAAEARALYKALGLDPTKTRPSNEALLRRVLRGEALYTINTLVDCLNLASLRHQMPFGLYDLDAVIPPVVLRLGVEGEAYEGIRKGPVHVAGRPVLVDARGPFGNPTSDSARTAVSLSTRRAWVVAYAAATMSGGRLEAIVADTASLLVRHCGGWSDEPAFAPQ